MIHPQTIIREDGFTWIKIKESGNQALYERKKK